MVFILEHAGRRFSVRQQWFPPLVVGHWWAFLAHCRLLVNPLGPFMGSAVFYSFQWESWLCCKGDRNVFNCQYMSISFVHHVPLVWRKSRFVVTPKEFVSFHCLGCTRGISWRKKNPNFMPACGTSQSPTNLPYSDAPRSPKTRQDGLGKNVGIPGTS